MNKVKTIIVGMAIFLCTQGLVLSAEDPKKKDRSGPPELDASKILVPVSGENYFCDEAGDVAGKVLYFYNQTSKNQPSGIVGFVTDAFDKRNIGILHGQSLTDSPPNYLPKVYFHQKPITVSKNKDKYCMHKGNEKTEFIVPNAKDYFYTPIVDFSLYFCDYKSDEKDSKIGKILYFYTQKHMDKKIGKTKTRGGFVGFITSTYNNEDKGHLYRSTYGKSSIRVSEKPFTYIKGEECSLEISD